MNLKTTDIKKKLEGNLLFHLRKITPNHKIRDVYKYATTPPGKLFRPLLARAAALDFSSAGEIKKIEDINEKSDIGYLASALELHHAYTLVHDDLPSMDNDNFRRGKKSTHIEYSDWQAILVGDGLLNGSYELIANISTNSNIIFRLFCFALGPRGLIQGQVIDLSTEMKQNFSNIIRAHELKTARLIQLSLILGFLTLKNPILKSSKYRTVLNLAKLGRSIGVIFQLLDDLTELSEDLGKHELDINPWLNFVSSANRELIRELNHYSNTIKQLELTNIHENVKQYFAKMSKRIKDGENIINKNIKLHGQENYNLAPVVTLLNTLSS